MGKGNYAFNGALEGSRPFVKYLSAFSPVGTIQAGYAAFKGYDLLNFNFSSNNKPNLGNNLSAPERLLNGVLAGREYGARKLGKVSHEIYKKTLKVAEEFYQNTGRTFSVGGVVRDFVTKPSLKNGEGKE